MQKKEKILGEAGKAPGGGALGPGVAPVTFGLFLLPGGRRGDASPERMTMILQQLELSYFCCHGGGRDPAAPSEGEGLDGTHLHQPYGKVGRKTLDGKEDDAAEDESGLGFLPSPKVIYL
jgi:hypothetical protein